MQKDTGLTLAQEDPTCRGEAKLTRPPAAYLRSRAREARLPPSATAAARCPEPRHNRRSRRDEPPCPLRRSGSPQPQQPERLTHSREGQWGQKQARE